MIDLVVKIQDVLQGEVFTTVDLKMLMPGLSDAALHNKLSRETKQGKLLRLKRGVYALSPRYQRSGLHPFSVAHKLCFPSYVSFESALLHHGLIPEAVATTTCATLRPSVSYTTPIGYFDFINLPKRLYPMAVERVHLGPHVFLAAHPLKALLDLVYTRKQTYQTLKDLRADLRIDLDELACKLKPEKNKDIRALKGLYKRENVTKVIDLVLWELL